MISSLLRADPWQLVVPGMVYRELEKRGRCCSCFPYVIEIIVETTQKIHREINSSETQVVFLIERLREKHLAVAARPAKMTTKFVRVRAA